MASERLALTSLAASEADAAHAALTAVHGIGPWTADIYLLSCLGHADAWPAGDLALQGAARLAFALPERPSAKEMVALAEIWRPLRAVAARVLWTYYRAVKGREGAPIPAPAAPPTLPKLSLSRGQRKQERNKQARTSQDRSKEGRGKEDRTKRERNGR